MSKAKAYIIDDEPDIGELLQFFLSPEFDCTTENNPANAMAHLATESYDLVITDYKMNNYNGFEILQTAHRTRPDCCKILMTGAFIKTEDMESACPFKVTLLEKPFSDPKNLLNTVMQAYRQQ